MQGFTYPITLTPDEEDGGYIVTCRDLSELITQCDTIELVQEEAEGALEAAIEMRIADGMDIPNPSPRKKGEHLVSLPIGVAMKTALYVSMREQGVSKSDLARRLGLDEKEARRMLDPKHGTKVPAIERALHVLGKRVELTLV